LCAPTDQDESGSGGEDEGADTGRARAAFDVLSTEYNVKNSRDNNSSLHEVVKGVVKVVVKVVGMRWCV
jgi:hypothetical protein